MAQACQLPLHHLRVVPLPRLRTGRTGRPNAEPSDIGDLAARFAMLSLESMLSRSLLACALLLPLAACEQAAAPVARGARRAKVAAAPLQPVRVSADIAAFYRERGSRPIWVDPARPAAGGASARRRDRPRRRPRPRSRPLRRRRARRRARGRPIGRPRRPRPRRPAPVARLSGLRPRPAGPGPRRQRGHLGRRGARAGAARGARPARGRRRRSGPRPPPRRGDRDEPALHRAQPRLCPPPGRRAPPLRRRRRRRSAPISTAPG